MKKRIVATLIGAMGIGLALGSPGNASAVGAVTRNFHAMTCRSTTEWASNGVLTLNEFGQAINWNPNSIVLVCPFDADSAIGASATKYNLDVYSSGAGNITTKSCVTYWNGGGGSCDDTPVPSTVTNVESIEVTPVRWHTHGTTGSYPYVWVQLGSGNVLFGYTVTQ